MKRPLSPIDKQVGTRLRMRRLLLGLTQEKLAAALGLTFQQVQKYERGTSQVSASRLWNLSEVLQVPVCFFFEDPLNPSGSSSGRWQVRSDFISEFLATSDGLALARAFTRIKKPKTRRNVVRIVEEVADKPG